MCPSGYYCTTPSALPIACSDGFYSSEGESTCIPCPPGSYCVGAPRDEASKSSCPAGTYSLGEASYCSECPKGYYCPDSAQSPEACPNGYYADIGNMTACDRYTSSYHRPERERNTLKPACSLCTHVFFRIVLVQHSRWPGSEHLFSLALKAAPCRGYVAEGPPPQSSSCPGCDDLGRYTDSSSTLPTALLANQIL